MCYFNIDISLLRLTQIYGNYFAILMTYNYFYLLKDKYDISSVAKS